MKYLFFLFMFVFANLGYAQAIKKNTLVVNYDSTYAGPRLGTGSLKFVGNLKSKSEHNFSKLWSQVTPANEGKWERIGLTPDTTTWNWEPITKLYNYAKANKIQFKYHTLIWGRQQPKWMSDLKPEDQLKYITYWIKEVGRRFPDAKTVDVVNESLGHHWPPDGRPETANYIKALGGNGKTGYDWVIKSFELARKYMPNTKLILNDYGIVNKEWTTLEYLELINLLKDRGLIDGIGIQCHRGELIGLPVKSLKKNLDRLAATGLPIYPSEIDLGGDNPLKESADQEQLDEYKRIIPILWKHPAVVGITFWGYTEGNMWMKNRYLIRKDGTWRPAMIWLADYLNKNPRNKMNKFQKQYN